MGAAIRQEKSSDSYTRFRCKTAAAWSLIPQTINNIDWLQPSRLDELFSVHAPSTCDYQTYQIVTPAPQTQTIIIE